jgi:hypothetical protein
VGLSIIETVLVFVGIPVLVFLILAGLVLGGTARRVNKRYRPGRPFDFTPVWLLAAPAAQHSTATAHGAAAELGSAQRPALTKSPAWERSEAEQHVTGGASDRW